MYQGQPRFKGLLNGGHENIEIARQQEHMACRRMKINHVARGYVWMWLLGAEDVAPDTRERIDMSLNPWVVWVTVFSRNGQVFGNYIYPIDDYHGWINQAVEKLEAEYMGDEMMKSALLRHIRSSPGDISEELLKR